MKQKQYIRVGQSAKNSLFGVTPPVRRGPSLKEDKTPLNMMVSDQSSVSQTRLAVVLIGVFTLAMGIILSSIPWVDYLIYKNLRLWNGTLGFYYWQKPGVNRLTKIWVFNMTNPDEFLNQGQKPRLEEIGPFVYREDMEKVNIKFHDNGTVSFQHKKILNFDQSLSVPRNTKLTVPNIPLLTLSSKLSEMAMVIRLGMSVFLKTVNTVEPFSRLTADEFMFGYDDTLTHLANKFYPRNKRPPSRMGLLLGRNATALPDVASIFTGHTRMEDFGYMDLLNGQPCLPFWSGEPCNSIRASEGSLFPPREVTKSDVVHVWDKDLCRSWALRYRGDTTKNGVKVGLYTPDENLFTSGDKYEANKCYCPGRKKCPPDGLQSIQPCQFDAPIYTSFPHFLGVRDPEILDAVDGLQPDYHKHKTVFKIQPKLGVPLEARVRVQINIQVSRSNLGGKVSKFPTIMFPLFWVEEGAEEIPPNIVTLIYLATTVCDWLVPLFTWGMVTGGAAILIGVFVTAYRHMIFTKENLERSKRKLRRGSSFLVNGQHRLLILRDSYTLLQNQTAETSFDPDPDV